MSSNKVILESAIKKLELAKRTDNDDESLSLSMPKLKTSEVDAILDSYQNKYGQEFLEPIVASNQGKQHPPSPSIYPSRQQLYSASNLKHRSTAYFRVKDPSLDEMILFS